MADFTIVDPKGWEYDLHSVYSAYIGYFQTHNIPWWERSWGFLFSSFEEFLTFSWPVIVVTDSWTGRAHIVTKLGSLGAFLKMIKTRFGETLPPAPNILQIVPFETSTRHLRHLSDWQSYRKLHATLPAAVLSALKVRVRAGEPKSIRQIWGKREKTFLSLSFEWSERNEKSCLEFGYAAVRCGHLDAVNHWPPLPDNNYRKGHFIVSDYVDKVFNKVVPTFPWQYMFGDSQFVPKAKLPQVIQAVISSFATPESETSSNTLVLVGHGIHNHLARLEDMKIKIPHNVLVLDLGIYERNLHSSGYRPAMIDPKTTRPRAPGTTFNLETIIRTFSVYPIYIDADYRHSSSPSMSTSNSSGSGASPGLSPHTPNSATLQNGNGGARPSNTPSPEHHNQIKRGPIQLPNIYFHNSGNDAFLILFALQLLLEPSTTQVFTVTKAVPGPMGVGMSMGMGMNMNMGMNMGMPMGMPMGMGAMPMGGMPMGIPMGIPMGMGMPMNMAIGVPKGMVTPPLGSPGLQVPGQAGVAPGSPYLRAQGSSQDLAGDFAAMNMNRTHSKNSSPQPPPSPGPTGRTPVANGARK